MYALLFLLALCCVALAYRQIVLEKRIKVQGDYIVKIESHLEKVPVFNKDGGLRIKGNLSAKDVIARNIRK